MGICTFHPTDDFKSPKWNWSPVVEQFTWSPQCEDIPFPHTSVSISPSNWDKVFAWIKQQKWRNTEGVGTSWIEMAAKAYFDGLRLDKLNTPKSYVHAIQKVVNQTAKLDSSIELVPHPSIKRCKTNGKSHPMRMIPNFEMLVTPEALKFVATSMLRGHHNPRHPQIKMVGHCHASLTLRVDGVQCRMLQRWLERDYCKSFVSVHLLFQFEPHLPSRLTEGEARGEGNHELKSCYDYLHGNRKCRFFLPRVAELEISENLALLLFPLSFSCRTLFAVISTQSTQL